MKMDCVVCSAEERVSREMKTLCELYNPLLPYGEVLGSKSKQLLLEIQTNLGKAVALRELRPAADLWSARLERYIRIFGLKFTKDDHINLIKLMFSLVTIPELEPLLLNRYCVTLSLLLKKKERILPDELSLPWKPLFDVCKRIKLLPHARPMPYRYMPALEKSLSSVVHAVRVYFPLNATAEILQEVRPLICPFKSWLMLDSIIILEWFLPVTLAPENSHLGYELWFEEVISLWSACKSESDWEPRIMWILARLARHNLGHVNWEPHMAVIFNRILKAFYLPVLFKKNCVSYRPDNIREAKTIETPAMALWIVSVLGGNGSGQLHLDQLMKVLSPYYHSTFYGLTAERLDDFILELSLYFVQRVNLERNKKLTWETRVKDGCQLSDDDITHFVETLKPVVLSALYSKFSFGAHEALHHLATLRPKLFVLPILSRFHTFNDRMTEPYKLISTILALISIVRPLAQPESGEYLPERVNLIPLMTSLLPAIDANDLGKSIVAFSFYTMVFSVVPIVDSSQAVVHVADLTEDEKELCELTAAFEEFVVGFMDRCFLLITNSEHHEQFEPVVHWRSTFRDDSLEYSLHISTRYLLEQMSPDLCRVALRKLVTFIRDSMFELNIAVERLSIMCLAFAQSYPKETLDAILPYLCSEILERLDAPDAASETSLDNAFLYKMFLLAKMVYTPAICPYIQQLTPVLDRTLHLNCRRSSALASEMLLNLMMALSSTVPREYRSTPDLLSDPLPIRSWGVPGNIDDLRVRWYYPGPEEVAAANDLVSRYLPLEVSYITSCIGDSSGINRNALHRALDVIQSCLACKPLLPVWDEPPISPNESCLESTSWKPPCGVDCGFVTMPGGENIRKMVADLMGRLLATLLEKAEDDVESFVSMIKIFQCCIYEFNPMIHPNDVGESKLRNLKRAQNNILLGSKKHVRAVLLHRLRMQHVKLVAACTAHLTGTHIQILKNMLKLSTSRYSEVRRRAQEKMIGMLETFTDSYLLLMDDVVDLLKLDSNLYHEQFKGVLHTIIGLKPKSGMLSVSSMLSVPNWRYLSKLLPAIVDSMPSEKLSVVRLTETITKVIPQYLPTVGVTFDVPQDCIEAALVVWCSASPQEKEQIDKCVGQGRVLEAEKNALNTTYFKELESAINRSLENSELHWRHQKMATMFLFCLWHPDVNYGEQTARYYTEVALNNLLVLRRAGIGGLMVILNQQKKLHPKVPVDPSLLPSRQPVCSSLGLGVRDDNRWLLYNSSTKPTSASEWDQPRYVHKLHVGFYHWPQELSVYAPTDAQPNLDRPVKNYTSVEMALEAFFSDPEKFGKFMTFLSTEEGRSQEKFECFTFLVFKGLCRNFGDRYLPLMLFHLNNFTSSKVEYSQRAATEMIAGIIRGSKHWPYDKVELMWRQLGPIIRQGLENVLPETKMGWGTCIATAVEGRDPNRCHWLLETLMEAPIREEPSHISCGRLYALQGALTQLQWRVPELNSRLLEFIKQYLAHPYQNIRQRLGGLLVSIFDGDSSHTDASSQSTPRISDFVDYLLSELEILNSHPGRLMEPVNELASSLAGLRTAPSSSKEVPKEDRETALRLLKTVCSWITASICHSAYGASPHVYKLIPLLCEYEQCEGDEELTRECNSALSSLCINRILPHYVPVIVEALQKASISSSWTARVSCCDYITAFTQVNVFILLKEPQYLEKIVTVSLELLLDEWSDVRIAASSALAVFFYIDVVQDKLRLLEEFKRRASRKARTPLSAAQLKGQHSGILGLCAFVTGHPFILPEPLPELLVFLSQHLSDPAPIPDAIRKAFSNFLVTHREMAELESFPEELSAVLSGSMVAPAYIA